MCHELENQSCISEKLAEPLNQIFCLLSDSLSENVTARLSGMLPDFDLQGKKTTYDLEAIKKQVETVSVNSALLENANQTNRILGPQFYDERIIQPMARGLFPIVDFIDTARETIESDLPEHQSAIQYFIAIGAQLEQFFGNYGIESFSHKTEEQFKPKLMKPLKTISTNDADLDGLIAESLQRGFKKQQRILRLETVSLYKYQEQKIETII